MSNTKFGTFRELLELTQPPLQIIVRRLRDIILEVDPDSVEVVRLGDRAATYGVGPKKMTEGYCCIIPQASWINLCFYRAASLPDPEGLFEGTGVNMRHIKIRSLEQAEQPAIRTYIQNALEERKQALGR